MIVSKYKNVFAKCYVPNWSKEVFFIKSAVNVFKRNYWNFLRKRVTNDKSKKISIENVIKRKGNKLKWKVYDNYFNSYIDENDIVI